MNQDLDGLGVGELRRKFYEVLRNGSREEDYVLAGRVAEMWARKSRRKPWAPRVKRQRARRRPYMRSSPAALMDDPPRGDRAKH